MIKSSKRIRFDGDGYSPEWQKEAAKRKLSNNKTTPKAVGVYTSKASLELFDSMNVMSEVEVRARQEVDLETYILQTQIEGRVLNELINNYILPATISFQNKVLENVRGLKEVYGASYKKMAEGQLAIIDEISKHFGATREKTVAMTEARKKANVIQDVHKKADAYCYDVRPFFDDIRYHCDKLEQLIENESWPIVKYRELLFIK